MRGIVTGIALLLATTGADAACAVKTSDLKGPWWFSVPSRYDSCRVTLDAMGRGTGVDCNEEGSTQDDARFAVAIDTRTCRLTVRALSGGLITLDVVGRATRDTMIGRHKSFYGDAFVGVRM